MSVEQLLKRALDKGSGTHEVEDILLLIENKQAQLWSKGDSCLVTQLIDFPQKRRLHVLLGAGEMSEVLSLVEEELVPFAKQHGCKEMSLVGRKGWKKVLADTGWTEDYVSLYRGLE